MSDEAPRKREPHLRTGDARTGPGADGSLMDVVGRLAGEPGIDHPSCVHPVLGAVARSAYDLSSEKGRASLLPMAPSLLGTACTGPAGLEMSARLVATCVSTAFAGAAIERIGDDESRRLETARRTALYLLAGCGATIGSGELTSEDPQPRRITRWWLRALEPVRLTEPVYRVLVAPEMVARAVGTVARTSGEECDQRLRRLLRWCVAVAGSLGRGR